MMKFTDQQKAEIAAKELARRIVREILDEGLARSTWREHNGEAYEQLLRLRPDLELSVIRAVIRVLENLS